MALCGSSAIAIAAAVVGVVALVKGFVLRRRFGGGHCGGRGGHGFRRWGGRRGIGRSFWLRALYARLDTTPGQEREIRAAIEDLQSRARDAKSALPETRTNIGKALAGETFDESAFEAVRARLDATGEMLKDALSSALKRIHGVLDPKQRERLAAIVSEGGFGRWGRGGGYGGPYRGGAEI